MCQCQFIGGLASLRVWTDHSGPHCTGWELLILISLPLHAFFTNLIHGTTYDWSYPFSHTHPHLYFPWTSTSPNLTPIKLLCNVGSNWKSALYKANRLEALKLRDRIKLVCNLNSIDLKKKLKKEKEEKLRKKERKWNGWRTKKSKYLY